MAEPKPHQARWLALAAVGAVALAAKPAPPSQHLTGGGRQQMVDVVAGRPLEFAFSLSTDRVTTGRVVFRVSNAGRIPHDFAIRGRITRLILPDRSTILTVRFLVPGIYTYLCTVPGHASAGMVGQLTVTGRRLHPVETGAGTQTGQFDKGAPVAVDPKA